MARKASTELAMEQRKPSRKSEGFAGFTSSRTCGNCDHFDAGGVNKEGGPIKNEGVCHNGISGRIKTTVKHGCGHGFYPCTVRWPLKAGPGGVR